MRVEVAHGLHDRIIVFAIRVKVRRLQHDVADDAAALTRVLDLNDVELLAEFRTGHDETACAVENVMVADELEVRVPNITRPNWREARTLDGRWDGSSLELLVIGRMPMT